MLSQPRARVTSTHTASTGVTGVDGAITTNRPRARRDLLALLAGYADVAADRAKTRPASVTESELACMRTNYARLEFLLDADA